MALRDPRCAPWSRPLSSHWATRHFRLPVTVLLARLDRHVWGSDDAGRDRCPALRIQKAHVARRGCLSARQTCHLRFDRGAWLRRRRSILGPHRAGDLRQPPDRSRPGRRRRRRDPRAGHRPDRSEIDDRYRDADYARRAHRIGSRDPGHRKADFAPDPHECNRAGAGDARSGRCLPRRSIESRTYCASVMGSAQEPRDHVHRGDTESSRRSRRASQPRDGTAAPSLLGSSATKNELQWEPTVNEGRSHRTRRRQQTHTSTPSTRQACARRSRHPSSMTSACPTMRRRAGRSSMAWMERAAAALSGIFFLTSGGTRSRS